MFLGILGTVQYKHNALPQVAGSIQPLSVRLHCVVGQMMVCQVVVVTNGGQGGLLSDRDRGLHLDRDRSRGADLLHLTAAGLLLHNEWQCVVANVAITPVICLHLSWLVL